MRAGDEQSSKRTLGQHDKKAWFQPVTRNDM